MSDVDLQSEYLSLLGITEWEKQENNADRHEIPGYYVVINEPGIKRFDNLTQEKQDLLLRMIAAVNWPSDRTTFTCIQKTGEPALQFGKGEQWAYLPSLDELINDRTAKQRAWLLMKSLNI